MKLSIVTTLYYSARHLSDLHARLSAAASRISDDYEIIFVNDGSPDNSLDLAVMLCNQDHRVRVIDLSRNFGQHKAIMTGLAHVRGEFIFLLDSDLEEDPELLIEFWDLLRESGADVVYGVQVGRKGGLIERITGDLFYATFNLFSTYPVPVNQVTARLMKRSYVQSLVAHQDREVFLAGLWAITGFNQIETNVIKRSKGSSTYSLSSKLDLLVNSITSFSNKPLVYIFYLGCIILITAAIAALFLVVRRIFFGIFLIGWPSLIVSIWLLGGLMIFCLGIIGIYLSKVFMETKQRPYTVIRQIYEQ